MQADPDTDVNKKKNQKDVYRQCEDTTGPIYICVVKDIYARKDLFALHAYILCETG
jgi:hypothetical protein